MTDRASGSQESDFRRLGRWLLVVGTIAVIVAGVFLLLLKYGAGGARGDAAACFSPLACL